MNDIFAQVKNLWDQMDTTRRVMAVVVLLLVLGSIIFMVRVAGTPKYELLYSSLGEQDRSEIITKLEELKISYRTTSTGGIEVPNAVSVRANLLKEGIPRGGVVGWEIFDQNSFSATDFSNQMNRQRAIAGELTRTLQNLDGISNAKILLNIPDPAEYIFAEEKPEGTASVQLQLRAPGALSEPQVEAIANLLAASTGVKPENVTIIDNYANDLTSLLRAKRGPRAGVTSAVGSFSAKIDYETQAEKRIESMLNKVFGYNKAVVRVNAELDLDYQEIKSETFGEQGVPRSEQERTETYQGTGGNGSGVPGTDSNITQYKTDDGQNSKYSSEKTERTVNYELNKVEEFRIAAPGKVKRLSVGVWVDGNLPAARKQQIINTVGAAVGISDERKDLLTVETINFNKPPEPKAEKVPLNIPWESIIQYVLLGVFLIGLLLVLRRVFVAAAPGEKVPVTGSRIDTIIEDNARQEQAAVLEISPEEKARIDRITTIEKIAMDKPDEVAALLKTWLSEDV